jgi:hypothetical protein
MPGLRTCAYAAPEPGGKEHKKNLSGGGEKSMNKTRIVAIVIIGLLVFSMLASLVIPFMVW